MGKVIQIPPIFNPNPIDVVLSGEPTSVEADTTHSVVSVVKTTAITLLPANAKRLGMTFTNRGTQEVVVRFKEATTDNLIEGHILAVGETWTPPRAYIGEVSAIRLTTTGAQTGDVYLIEW